MAALTLTTGRTIAVGTVIAVAASALTVLAESKLAPSGTFRVAVTGGSPTVQLPHLATFVPDGGVISSTIPVACLMEGQSMSAGHGQWSFKMRGGVPTLRFYIVADLYTQGGKSPNGSAETTFDGSVSIDASVPLTTSDAVKGVAKLSFPAGHPCAPQFDGPVSFVATPASAEPPPSPKE